MRIGALLGIAVGIAACAESPSPVAPAGIDEATVMTAEVSSTELTVPWSATLWISCANGGAGESVALSGWIVIQSHETVDDAGGKHLWSHVRPSGVIGVGATSGRTYRGTGGTFEGILDPSDGDPSVYTLVNNFRIIGSGPGNNLLVHIVVHQTYDANGELRADVDLSSNNCR